MPNLTLPGLIDIHVHLREPGARHKEDILSGTRAALAGGVIGILDMPNNTPPTVAEDAFFLKRTRFQQQAVSDYGLFVGYDGEHLDPVLRLAPHAVGLKLYLDETFGHLTTREPRALAALFEAWPGPGPIAIHAESPTIAMALGLARRYHQALHVCHVPHPNDLPAIDAARQAGALVTCEVTPHHLFLDDTAVARLGAYAQMKPPLVSPDLVARFWERLDLVDAVATDHAPHTREEKESAQPPPGVPGLETTLPLLLGAVDAGRLTIERLVALTHTNPLRIYGLAAPEDSGIDVEVGAPYALPAEGYRTRCGWSPFAGHRAVGRVRRVRLRGEIAWEDGTCRVEPGYGRPLARQNVPVQSEEA